MSDILKKMNSFSLNAEDTHSFFNDFKKLNGEEKEAFHSFLDFELKPLHKKSSLTQKNIFFKNHKLKIIILNFLKAIYKPATLNQDILSEKHNFNDINKILQNDGYFILNDFLDQTFIDKLLNDIFNEKFVGMHNSVITGQKLINRCKEGKTNLNTNYQSQNDLSFIESYRELALNKIITSVCMNYLECMPIHVKTGVSFNFPCNAKHYSQQALLFHQDMEGVKFIKVFIYLNDVNEENGAHCYIRGSNKDTLYGHGYEYSDRISNDEAKKIYGEDRIKYASGGKGTAIFGDTSCVHKGTPLLKGYRILVTLQYTATLMCSNYLPKNSFKLYNDSKYDRKFLERFYMNYDNNLLESFLEINPKFQVKNTLSLKEKLNFFKERLKNKQILF